MTYTQSQVINDFDFLYQSLIDTHYDPYAYISPRQLEAKYHSLRDELTAPSYSLLETITHYQQLVSSLKNGHTEVDFPVASYLAYAKNDGTLFPLDLAFEEGKALVRANYSDNSSIMPGDELLAINSMPISEVLTKIFPLISAEREYFKLAKLEVLSFPRYYWYALGQYDSYSIKLKMRGDVQEIKLDPIAVFADFEEKKDEVLRAQQTLHFYHLTAYLNPGHFSGDEEKYRAFIDQSFSKIKEKRTENLIIDLRNNTGGNDSFSDYLVSYLADRPFKWNSQFKLRTSKLLKQDTKQHRNLNDPYWRSIMDNKGGERYEFEFGSHPPVETSKRYEGKVYVLINRQTHSQASVTASQFQDYGWATLVGEETGDFPTLYASQFQFALPVTGIIVKISKGYIVRVSGSKAQRGVVPDILIRDKLLDNQDEILTALLQRIDAPTEKSIR